MDYSEKLNGFYSEGYHYYIEIRDDYFSLRDYRKKLIFETKVHYDFSLIEKDERTPLTIDETVISTSYDGEMMSCVKDLYYDKGKIYMLHYYTILGETNYVLEKKDEGPFAGIKLRNELLEGLQGKWIKYKTGEVIEITNDVLAISYGKQVLSETEICVVEQSSGKCIISPKDLTESVIGQYTALNIDENMLTGYEIVFDMDMPLSVFVREGYQDQVDIPKEAKREPKSSMLANE